MAKASTFEKRLASLEKTITDFFQGSSTKPYLDEVPEGGEKYGIGVNSYSYWVSSDPLGRWT